MRGNCVFKCNLSLSTAILNHVFQSAGEQFSVASLVILFSWCLIFLRRNPDSERSRDEQNGPPGTEVDGDIEVRSKSN